MFESIDICNQCSAWFHSTGRYALMTEDDKGQWKSERPGPNSCIASKAAAELFMHAHQEGHASCEIAALKKIGQIHTYHADPYFNCSKCEEFAKLVRSDIDVLRLYIDYAIMPYVVVNSLDATEFFQRYMNQKLFSVADWAQCVSQAISGQKVEGSPRSQLSTQL